jgi:5'-nucleotidase
LDRELTSGPAESRIEGVAAWQVEGTPSDAAFVGMRRHAVRRVAMVVSGVNAGPNIGLSVVHSGTVGAAIQGLHHKIPAVAVSLASFEPTHLEDAATIGARIAGALLASGETLLLNVNAPDLPLASMGAVRVTEMAQDHALRMVEEVGPTGVVARRMEYRDAVEFAENSDVWAVRNGYVSVTPMETDLTHRGALTATSQVIGRL